MEQKTFNLDHEENLTGAEDYKEFLEHHGYNVTVKMKGFNTVLIRGD
jgi:hypothetical protein